MRIGAAFPTTEIGNDPIVIRDFVQAVEEMGYDHLTLIDHVIHSDASHGKLGGKSAGLFLAAAWTAASVSSPKSGCSPALIASITADMAPDEAGNWWIALGLPPKRSAIASICAAERGVKNCTVMLAGNIPSGASAAAPPPPRSRTR